MDEDTPGGLRFGFASLTVEEAQDALRAIGRAARRPATRTGPSRRTDRTPRHSDIGCSDGRGIAAASMLGASAARIGTAFLLVEEADTHPALHAAIRSAEPEETVVTRAFTGRQEGAIANRFTAARLPIAASPLQRALTGPMRAASAATWRA